MKLVWTLVSSFCNLMAMKAGRLKYLVFYTFILAVSAISGANAQSSFFGDIFLEPDEVVSGEYKGLNRFEFEEIAILIEPKKADRITILEADNDQQIFNFINEHPESYFSKPRFFKSDSETDPVVMMLDVHAVHSIGQQMFLIQGKEVINVGFLPYAVDDFNFSSLSLYSRFESEGETIFQSFGDIDIIDIEKEVIVKGSDLRFKIENNRITRISSN